MLLVAEDEKRLKHTFEVVTSVKLLTAVLQMFMAYLQQLPIPTTPRGIVPADHVIRLPQTKAGNTNMFVHINHATRYVIATSSASLAAYTVTDALYNSIILRYGPPSLYTSDRGTVFTRRHTQRLHRYEPRLSRELHIGSFVNDTPCKDQLDLLLLVRAEAANSMSETHLANTHRFDLHRRSPLRGSPIIDTPIIEEDDSLEEESESAAELQDAAEDLLDVPD
ncbi:hypothetical protein HNY73_003390 [Argiope bruennichi]|uniref:Integrase catalytic domain-containing protein n=1 Tax=Argiope bruennichi TaxID=94029 RepID=A0A8T0FKE4_ARGBR|nr:hypothetical protein HNY73_003390 [Argiope bruennichi]